MTVNEISKSLLDAVKESHLGRLPAFVRDHRMAKLGERGEDGDYESETVPEDALEEAHVVTSWTGRRDEPPVAPDGDWTALATMPETYHRPVLDIDFPAALLDSSTEGHHHLYLDKVLPWTDYVKLLDVLAEVGIIEPGYRDASVAREFTAVRLPWIRKGDRK